MMYDCNVVVVGGGLSVLRGEVPLCGPGGLGSSWGEDYRPTLRLDQ